MLLARTASGSHGVPQGYSSHENKSCEKFLEDTPKTAFCSKKTQNSNSGMVSAGLVSSSTSEKPRDKFKIEPKEARLKKMKCSVLTSSRLQMEDLQQGGFRCKIAMLTLTYQELDGWNPRHISELLTHIRKWCQRNGIPFRYVWVGELQKRGALHYHILIWLPKGRSLPKPDKQGWWKHGHTKIEWAKNALGYIAKYASKGQQDAHHFPKGCRIHGCGGLSAVARSERCWWSMPGWVREITTIEDEPRRPKGGGILLKSTGEILESPWRIEFTSMGIYAVRKQSQENQQG